MTDINWEIFTNETDDKQHSIDNMGDTLLEKLEAHINVNNLEEARAIFNEWIVDGDDPEDNEYEFLFLDALVDTP
tara:strand:+ start:730 stop:954 length:225 start_codon:yes stop_codon:yes gene_type:complete